MSDKNIIKNDPQSSLKSSSNIFNKAYQGLKNFFIEEDQEPLPPRSVSEYLVDYSKLILIATIIVAMDQFSKIWIRNTIPYGYEWMPIEWLSPFFRFVNWTNTGAAFGIFQGASMVFTVLAFIVTFMILFYYSLIPAHEKIQKFTLSMMLGGAIGNLIDRLQFGEVTDFIAVGSFPVFNIADSSITVGVSIMLIAYLIEWRKLKLSENID